MAQGRDTVTLYTAQSDAVIDAVHGGVAFSREEYVSRKYGESAPIFLTAYRWFAAEAQKLVPRPEEAGLPYWVFGSVQSVDRSGGGRLLTLEVPRDQAVFFDMYDWNRVLQLKYMGASEKQERAFCEELARRGLRESDVVLSQFYPDLRQQIIESWDRLFRHHESIRSGDLTGVGAVQAALWCIRREWVVSWG